MGGNTRHIIPVKKSPSSYIKDRLLSTRDKLGSVLEKDIIPTIIQIVDDKEGAVKNYTVGLDRPLFQPNPCVMTRQSYEPFMTYEVVLNFKNIDSVS